MQSGILNIYKPRGTGSTKVVNHIKRLLPKEVRIGHAGTLDAFATGVLLVLVGRQATRLCETLMNQPKQYHATIRFGATTPTDDPESSPRPVIGASAPSQEKILHTLASQTGLIQQIPPAFSALKIKGKRASDRLRQGERIELSPRPVRIDQIDLIRYEWPDLEIRVDCGRGTYIRSIARDVGQLLGVGGYLIQLERSRVGPFMAEDSIRLETLTSENIQAQLYPAEQIPRLLAGLVSRDQNS